MKKQEKPILDFNEQKELFNKFSLNTLESIKTLYDVLEEDYPLALRIVYNNNFENKRDEYEGINEYTYYTRVQNLDITEIIDKMNELSDKEIKFLSVPVMNAINTINSNDDELILIPKLVEFEKVQAEEAINRITPIANGLNIKDIKDFFNKFSYAGVGAFETILDFSNMDKIDDIKRARKEVFKSKEKKYTNNSTMTLTSVKGFRIIDLKSSLSSLTDKELEFFHDLVEGVSMYLDYIQEHSDYYKEVIEDFNIENYPVQEMSKLLDEIEKEQLVTSQCLYTSKNLESEEEPKEKTK